MFLQPSADNGLSSQSYGVSSSHVWMWELDCKEGWALKNWCFRIVVLEKTPETPLESKEIKPVNPKGNQPWVFIGRTDAKAETPILWPPDAKNWLLGKDPDAGKDWRWEEKGMTEEEMVVCIMDSMYMNLSKLWELVKDGKPGVLQSMGLQKVWHNWVIDLNWKWLGNCNLGWENSFSVYIFLTMWMIYNVLVLMTVKFFKKIFTGLLLQDYKSFQNGKQKSQF